MSSATQTDVPRDKRKFQKPVSWLLGRQLIASLKSTLLYTAFGTKIDARDWMEAKVFPPPDEEWEDKHNRDGETTAGDKPVDFKTKDGEFWFDYISDTGDGMTATYSIAYLCLSDLWIRKLWTEMPAVRPDQKFREKPKKNQKDETDERLLVRMKTKGDDLNGLKKLPRGEFLLVGGDTSYHMADYASLHMRFQLPFQWAYKDLKEDHEKLKAGQDLTEDQKDSKEDPELTVPKKMTKEEHELEIPRLRPLFGIPGNHDYYDMLDGFRRQFRKPTNTRSEETYSEDSAHSSQLQIPGFRRYQETSYIALRLPFDWWIWGLDTEVGKIDERQKDFFEGLGKPEKLIVCTSAPTTVFGKFADKNDEKSAKAFLQLKLPRPFLRSLNVTPTTIEEIEEQKEDLLEPQLKDEEIRLDLAGDVHHYARYWGPTGSHPQNTRHHSSDKKPKEKQNYASVMSGLGGAFHHPSTTYVDEIREQALYPDENESRRHVANEIFNPWWVVKGGGVWFLGGMLALILAFAAIADDSTRPAIHNFGLFTKFGITEPERYLPTVSSPEEAKRKQGEIRNTRDWQPRFSTHPDCTTPEALKLPVYLWGKCKVQWPGEYKLGFWLIILTVPIMGIGIYVMKRHYRAWDERLEVKTKARKAEQTDAAPVPFCNKCHKETVNWTIWSFTFGTALVAFVSVLLMMPYRNFITPFGNSLIVLLTICWAAAAIYSSLKYSDWLFEQASERQIRRRDWAITWVLAACALFGPAAGLWIFGKNNNAAYLVADIIAVLVAIAIPILLITAAWKLGGALKGNWGKFDMAFVGLWHAILQISIAVFLIKKGTWLTVLLAVLLVIVFWVIGKQLMRENWWKTLTVAWIVFGAVMLALPRLVYAWLVRSEGKVFSRDQLNMIFCPHTFDPTLQFSQYEWWVTFGGWWQLLPLLLAGVFGAFLSCIWLGWYLGVCLSFNGHNNESGGAARIEKFKQLIRFRLREDSLTGYVIAVRDPQRDGKKLHPEIVDIFHLTKVKQPSS